MFLFETETAGGQGHKSHDEHVLRREGGSDRIRCWSVHHCKLFNDNLII